MRDHDPVPMFCRRVNGPAVPDDGGSREALRAWLAARLREDLAGPVRVDTRRRDRITVMRGIEVRINRRTRSIVTHGRNGPAANDWLQGGMKLDRHLSGPYWARSWWWAVRGDAPAALRALGDGMLDVELPDWINRAARRSGLLRSARRKVMAALRLNPRLLARARALCRNGSVNSNHYEKVWRLPHASKIRMREAPRLWPLYDVLGLSPESDFDVVKKRLREEGLTRGGWKVLCRHGRALWWPARHCHEFGIAPRREVAFLTNLVAATGCEELPPTGLLLAVGRLASVHRLNAAESGRLLLPFRAAWRHLATIEEHARAAYLRGPVDAMLTEWMLRPLAPRVPHGVGWAWFDRWLDGYGTRCMAVAYPGPRLADAAGSMAWKLFPCARCARCARPGWPCGTAWAA